MSPSFAIKLRLQHHGCAQAAGCAGGAKGQVAAATLELAEGLRDLPGAGRREGVADRDRAAGHVELVPIDFADLFGAAEVLLRPFLRLEGLRVRQDLGGESLVHVDEVEVGELDASAVERDGCRVGRAHEELSGGVERGEGVAA